MILCKLIVFAAVISLSYCAEKDVIESGDEDFTSVVEEHETVLVMFYAPWCGHCKKIKPEFAKAAGLLKDDDVPVVLAKVDCTEAGKETCNKFSVSGYPTLKIFRGGKLSSEYNGPREAVGIVKYMKAQVGPSSKDLNTDSEFEAFISKDDVAVIGFFEKESDLKGAFIKAADALREKYRFGQTSNRKLLSKHDHTDAVLLYRPKHLHNKFEPGSVKYDGGDSKSDIESFIQKNSYGLVGHRTRDNMNDFKPPFVVAYYSVDYVKNVKVCNWEVINKVFGCSSAFMARKSLEEIDWTKSRQNLQKEVRKMLRGTNYWRNRILKVAKDFADSFTFAISSKDDFQHELNEYGHDYVKGDKPLVFARNAKNQKFAMSDEFSMETFETFLKELMSGKLEPYLKSEPIPDDNEGPVTVAVGKNFDDVVTNNGKDTLIEFYAPWCGHCKKLTPIFEELGEKMKDEDVAIVKMDATANDVPEPYDVRGFPTLYWIPKNKKKSPIKYDSGRELDDFIKYIAKHATSELKGYDSKGKEKKSEL